MPLTEFVPKMLYIPVTKWVLKKKNLELVVRLCFTWYPLVSIFRDPTAGPLRGLRFGGLPCASPLREPLGRPVVRVVRGCARCAGRCGGGTMWQTQTSTYISTYVECILRNHIYKNHRALFQKPNSMNWIGWIVSRNLQELSLMAWALPRSETGQFWDDPFFGYPILTP